MAAPEHLEILGRGAGEWNRWRQREPGTAVDLVDADLRGWDLAGADLSSSDLSRTILVGADLAGADLAGARLCQANLLQARATKADLGGADLSGAQARGAKLEGANLRGACLAGADLRGAFLESAVLADAEAAGVDLQGAYLGFADLTRAKLAGADLRGADLGGTVFEWTDLAGAKLAGAVFWQTVITSVDLSRIDGLSAAVHQGPSTINVRTFYLSRGKTPDVFLRGCGLADWEIAAAQFSNPELPEAEVASVVGRMRRLRGAAPGGDLALFIAYADADAAFIATLGPRLDAEGIRYWRGAHGPDAGLPEPRLERAVAPRPTFLVVLSRASVDSEWLEWELAKAWECEHELGRQVLCTIALDDEWKTADWSETVRADVERSRVVDFSHWRQEAAFATRFEELMTRLRSLRRAPDDAPDEGSGRTSERSVP